MVDWLTLNIFKYMTVKLMLDKSFVLIALTLKIFIKRLSGNLISHMN